MSRGNCRWCGAFLDALESHDEAECHAEHQRQVNERGAAKVRAILAAAKDAEDAHRLADEARAAIRPTTTYETEGDTDA